MARARDPADGHVLLCPRGNSKLMRSPREGCPVLPTFRVARRTSAQPRRLNNRYVFLLPGEMRCCPIPAHGWSSNSFNKHFTSNRFYCVWGHSQGHPDRTAPEEIKYKIHKAGRPETYQCIFLSMYSSLETYWKIQWNLRKDK